MTSVGVVRLVVEPSPSCPDVLLPQHCVVPTESVAQVCTPPAATVTNRKELETAVGESRLAVEPSPS